jgi:hypothetical protein
MPFAHRFQSLRGFSLSHFCASALDQLERLEPIARGKGALCRPNMVSTDAFSPSNVIGKSPCATWYMATGLHLELHQKANVNSSSSNAVYAIKSVSLESLGATARDLATVLRAIAAISSFCHPYLLPLLGKGGAVIFGVPLCKARQHGG